ncbi:MAG: hypothetical protein ACXVNM_07215 [Bacteroidia bacterium]
MFKSKKSLFITVPIVVFSWIYFGYKIYSALNGDEDTSIQKSSFLPITSVERNADTFSLFNNYNDPFLREIKRSPHTNGSQNRLVKPGLVSLPVVKPKTPVVPITNEWPNVQYSGILKNQTSSVSLLLVSINNKMYTLKKYDVAEGLKVVSFTNSEVTLAKGKEKKVFSR